MKVVYGARSCVWWDTIDKVGKTPPKDGISIPCCPHCGSVLFEVPGEKEWFDSVDKHDAAHPGYRAMIEWSRGKCFGSWAEAKRVYTHETGKQPPL